MRFVGWSRGHWRSPWFFRLDKDERPCFGSQVSSRVQNLHVTQDLFKLIGATITSVYLLNDEILVGTPRGTLTIKGDVLFSRLSPFYSEATPSTEVDEVDIEND